jgi:hypothetical protein
MDNGGTGFNRLQNVEHLERKAVRDSIIAQAWDALTSLGRPDAGNSKANTVEECSWCALGGDVPALRALKFGTIEEATQVLGDLKAEQARLNPVVARSAPRPTADDPDILAAARRSAAPALTPESIQGLRSLGLNPDLAHCKSESEMREVIAARKGK